MGKINWGNWLSKLTLKNSELIEKIPYSGFMRLHITSRFPGCAKEHFKNYFIKSWQQSTCASKSWNISVRTPANVAETIGTIRLSVVDVALYINRPWVSATNLPHWQRIFYKSPINERGHNLLAQSLESTVDGTVSHSKFAVCYPGHCR